LEDPEIKLKEINERVREIMKMVLAGDLSLLDFELKPLFREIRDSVNPKSINNYASTYSEMLDLLERKYNEFQDLINQINSDDLFLRFLEKNPNDDIISDCFTGCWRKAFTLRTVSLKGLSKYFDRFTSSHKEFIDIQHINRSTKKGEYIFFVPKESFSEKMMDFYTVLVEKLPCDYDDLFKYEKNQLVIFENFVYLLHLLQIGKVKFQKETNILYT
jgi:hypothetical protein